MEDYTYVEEQDGRPVVKNKDDEYVSILSIFHDYFDVENYSTTMSEQQVAEKYGLNLNQAFEAIQFCQSDGNFERLRKMCEMETADIESLEAQESGGEVKTKYSVEGGNMLELEEFEDSLIPIESAFEQMIFDESTPVTYDQLRRTGEAITLELSLRNGLDAEVTGGINSGDFYLGYRTVGEDSAASVRCGDEEMVEPVLDLLLGDLYEVSGEKGLEREM